MYRAGLALLAGDVDATIAPRQPGARPRRRRPTTSDAAPPRHCSASRTGTGATSTLAHDRYTESIACFEDGGYLPDVMGCSLALADIQITQGRLHDAQRTFRVRAPAHGRAPRAPGSGRHARRAEPARHRAQRPRRRRRAPPAQRRSSASTWASRSTPTAGGVATAWLRRAEGDLDTALRLLDEAEPLYNTDFSPPVRPVAALKAGVQVELGDLAAATRWADANGLGAG